MSWTQQPPLSTSFDRFCPVIHAHIPSAPIRYAAGMDPTAPIRYAAGKHCSSVVQTTCFTNSGSASVPPCFFLKKKSLSCNLEGPVEEFSY